MPVGESGSVSVGEISGVVAGAVSAAVSEKVGVGEVSANLFGGAPEIVEGLGLVGDDVSSGNEDTVCTDSLSTVWQVKRMVESSRCFIIGKAIKVPVCLMIC